MTTGSWNVALGATAMRNAGTGANYNVAVGREALNVVTGANNIGVGYNAGFAVTSGAYNTLIGNAADVVAGSQTYSTAIGAGALVSASNTIQLGRAAGTDAVLIPGSATVTGSVTSAGLTSTAANTFSGGATTISTNGAASVPPLKLSGTWYAAGTATTNKPQILAEPTGTTSTGWSVSGTGIGANAASGFVGNLIDLQLAGVSKFRVTSTGNVYGATINSDVNTDLVTAYSVVATGGLTVGGGTGIAKILSSVKSAFDCPSIAAGGEQTTTMTITGATTSSTVTVTPSAALPAGLPLPYARCTAADSITIYAPNPSAGALDPASMDYRVTVINF